MIDVLQNIEDRPLVNITQQQSADVLRIENKPAKRVTFTDARIFLSRVRNSFNRLPQALQVRINSIVLAYSGIAELPKGESLPTFQQISDLALQRLTKAEIHDDLDIKNLSDGDILQMRLALHAFPPLQTEFKAEYKQEELAEKFPQALELQKYLGADTKFNIYIHGTGEFYIVERSDGKKQTLRLMKTERSIDDIKKDLLQQPTVLPPMQVQQLNDGSIAILAEWANGHPPESLGEIKVCEQAAESLLTLPWEKSNPNTPFDLNRTNFIVEEPLKTDEQCKVFYVDNDLPELLVQLGLSLDIPQRRIDLLNAGKKKLYYGNIN